MLPYPTSRSKSTNHLYRCNTPSPLPPHQYNPYYFPYVVFIYILCEVAQQSPVAPTAISSNVPATQPPSMQYKSYI